MIDGLKPYPEYKESHLQWLGKIPRHWEVKRGKSIFQCVDKRSADGKEELLTVSSAKGVVPRKTAIVTMFKAESYVGYKLCWPGDLVINSLWAWGGGLGVSQHHGIVSSAYGVYRLRSEAPAIPEFIHEVVRSSPFNWELQVRSKGIWTSRLQLTDESFLDTPFHLPPVNEQATMVRFLNNANGCIERAIRAKKKLIALLNEQKQAIIHRAVTRGIDPKVPLKPSGFSWLGDIPKDWECVPLKSVCAIQSGVTLGKFYLGESLTEFPYLRVANVQAGRLDLESVKKIRVPVAEAKRSTLQVGDVLMTEGGDPDKLGRGCVWNGEISQCLHQNHVFAVRPVLSRLLPQFLAALLGSHYAKLYFVQTAKQTTNLASTNKTTIGQFRVLLPSVTEQAAILCGLNSELAPINSAMDRADREISLLREYRTRLTADVVTGKLDVREAARQLPSQDQRVLTSEPGETDNVEDEPGELEVKKE